MDIMKQLFKAREVAFLMFLEPPNIKLYGPLSFLLLNSCFYVHICDASANFRTSFKASSFLRGVLEMFASRLHTLTSDSLIFWSMSLKYSSNVYFYVCW